VSNGGDDENLDDSDPPWLPLYKKDLIDYYTQIHGGTPNDNDLGQTFEDLFQNFVDGNPVLSVEYGTTKNSDKSTGGTRNTVPDFKGDQFVHILDEVEGVPVRTVRISGSTWYELKSSTGGIYMSSNTYQVQGHIDNLAREFAGNVQKYAPQKFKPVLFLVTTADVPFSSGINNYARSKNVIYGQVIAQYRKIAGKWQFNFGW
jgi:hypothetical protein